MKGVNNWREFSDWLAPSVFDPDTILQQHDSDKEACLKAFIEGFLNEGGLREPTWRAVIRALYKAGENQVAQDIIAYAEPLKGVCVCACACTCVFVNECVYTCKCKCVCVLYVCVCVCVFMCLYATPAMQHDCPYSST